MAWGKLWLDRYFWKEINGKIQLSILVTWRPKLSSSSRGDKPAYDPFPSLIYTPRPAHRRGGTTQAPYPLFRYTSTATTARPNRRRPDSDGAKSDDSFLFENPLKVIKNRQKVIVNAGQQSEESWQNFKNSWASFENINQEKGKRKKRIPSICIRVK